jgi:hypothetical protein
MKSELTLQMNDALRKEVIITHVVLSVCMLDENRSIRLGIVKQIMH